MGHPDLGSEVALLHYEAREFEKADRAIRFLARSKDPTVFRALLGLAGLENVPLAEIARSTFVLVRNMPARESSDLPSACLSEPDIAARSRIVAAAALYAFDAEEEAQRAFDKALRHEGNPVVADYYRRVLAASKDLAPAGAHASD